MRILVIDDNPDDRAMVLREVFVVFPEASVVEVTDLEMFEAALSFGEPDLVLTDLDLRWARGEDVLMTAKARYPVCPVIIFTDSGNETVAVDLMKTGLDDYVVKSVRQLPRLRLSLKLAVEMAASRAALSDREALLTRALAQQQIVVRELHHRVKNNLQTVSSLLRMGRRNADASTRNRLDEIAGRMNALAAVQSRIYESIHLNEVDFTATLADIATSLIKIYHGDQASLVMPAAVPLVLDVARSMALSLICYEVILNAMKYAWVDRAPGTLTIEITGVGSANEIIIADDGAGFVEGAVERGMGGKFSQGLADQASAQLALFTSPGSGTRVVIRLR